MQGGVWTFFLEDLRKRVVGIDNDRTMMLIAGEYKKMYNKKSNFVLTDICDYKYKHYDSALFLDNSIINLNKKQFSKLLKQLDGRVKNFILEINKNRLIEKTLDYKFGTFDIQEKILRDGGNRYKRIFFNKQTGAKFSINSYNWSVDEIKKLLLGHGSIVIEKETSNSKIFFLRLQHGQ